MIEKIRQRVRSKIPDSDKHLKDSPLLDAALVQTVEALQGRNPNDDELDNQTLKRLRELAGEFVVRPREDETSQKAATPTDALYSETQLRHLAQRVEQLRRELFDCPEPRFATEQEAADWIKEVGDSDYARERRRQHDTQQERQKALEEISRLANEHLIEVDLTTTSLPYRTHQRPDRPVTSMPTIPGTTLHKLAHGTERMARYTKFSQADLVTYVLTDLPPEIPRITLTRTESYYAATAGGEKFLNKSANIEVNTPNLTRDELRDVHKGVRGHITGKSKKGEFDPEQIRVWELVRERGGPPREYGGKGRFWEEILEAWQSEQPAPRNGENLRYTTARGVESAYYKVQKRLSQSES